VHQKIDEHLRQQIIATCGDADVTVRTKHIDPALCIYIGAYFICIIRSAKQDDNYGASNIILPCPGS
jgi:hypothetical protein